MPMDYKNNHRPFIKRFLFSFVCAWSGLKRVLRAEQNIKIHIVIAFTVLVFAYVLNIPRHEIFVLLIVIGNVIALEVMNTAIETVVNLVTEEYHPLAKLAKDISAGAVLIFSFFALLIGILIFSGPFGEFINKLLL